MTASAIIRSSPDLPPVVRPFLDVVHGYVAQSVQPVLCRCRLRLWLDRVSLQGIGHRNARYVALITELPPGEAYNQNPGLEARLCLTLIANQVRRVYVGRRGFGAEREVLWFHQQPGVVSADRPRPHDELHAIEIKLSESLVQCYQEARLGAIVAPADIELAAGGMVEL